MQAVQLTASEAGLIAKPNRISVRGNSYVGASEAEMS